jgi:hypothetical protein
METGFHAPSVEEQRTIISKEVAGRTLHGAGDGATPNARQYRTELYGLAIQNERMGVEAATIVSLLPRRAKVHSALFRNLIVPACPLDQPYTMLVIREPRYTSKDNEGSFSPVCLLPMLLAKEFESKYSNTGGLFVIRGDGTALEWKLDGSLLNDPEIATQYAQAKAALITTAVKDVQEADNEWHSPHRSGARNITDRHRSSCRLLMRERRLANPKEWLDATREEAQIAEPCPSCGSEPRNGAALCATCGWVIDPLKAWTIGAQADPQHNSLARLARKVLEGLGITKEDIPETIEERDARLRGRINAKAGAADAKATTKKAE